MRPLVFGLLMIASGVCSQTPVDSLQQLANRLPDDSIKLKVLQKIYRSLNESDPERMVVVRQAHDLAKTLNDKRSEGQALVQLAICHQYAGTYDSSRHYFDRSVRFWEELEEPKQLWRTQYYWSRLENLQGNFDAALQQIDQAISLALAMDGLRLSDSYQRKASIFIDQGAYKRAMENMLLASRVLDTLSQPDQSREAKIQVGIGRIEMLRDHYQEALGPMQRGLKIFQEVEDVYWQNITHLELGSAYYHMKDFNKARQHYQSSLELSQIMNRDDFLSASLGNLGAVYMETGAYERALEHFEQGLEITRRLGSVNNLIITYNDLGSVHLAMNNHQKAITYYSTAIRLADSINALDILADAYLERAEAYQATGDYLQALNDFKTYQEVKDSVFNLNKARQIDELRTRYETEKKEQALKLQQQEIDLLKREADLVRLQRLLLGAGLLLALIAFYGVRQKLKRNRAEKEKVDAQLTYKQRELATHALHLAKKNELLEALKQQAVSLKQKADAQKDYQQLIRTIEFDLKDDRNWENFSRYFHEVHPGFNQRVTQRFPELTPNELRLLALLKMNLTSKEIASILNISSEGIKKARYRLRKKMDISTDDSLQEIALQL